MFPSRTTAPCIVEDIVADIGGAGIHQFYIRIAALGRAGRRTGQIDRVVVNQIGLRSDPLVENAKNPEIVGDAASNPDNIVDNACRATSQINASHDV